MPDTPDTKISIIRPTTNDWQLLRTIRLESLKNDPQAFNSKYEEIETQPQSYWQALLNNPDQIYAFAKNGDKTVGLMNLALNEPNEPKDTAIVHNAYVTKDFRGLGVGRLLLGFLVSEAQKLGNIKKLKLWVKESQVAAQKLYVSEGFTFVTRAGEHVLVMEKIL